MKAILPSLVRGVVMTAGGGLMASGSISGTDLELVAGAIATIISIAWSVVEKRRSAAR